MTPDEKVEAIVASMRVVTRDGNPRWAEAADIIEQRARDHAALLDWAARAAESLRGISGDLEWVITEANPEHDGGYARLRLHESAALLAEWAEMQERPS